MYPMCDEKKKKKTHNIYNEQGADLKCKLHFFLMSKTILSEHKIRSVHQSLLKIKLLLLIFNF